MIILSGSRVLFCGDGVHYRTGCIWVSNVSFRLQVRAFNSRPSFKQVALFSTVQYSITSVYNSYSSRNVTMAKWDVILTVIALNFLVGVLSQTDINTPNATIEENNDAGTSLNLNTAPVSPYIAINEEIPGKHETLVSAGQSQPTNNQTTTSTFPPLIHNLHPQDVTTSTQSTESTTPTTSQTTKMPVHEEEKSVQKSQTDKINASKSTPKGNSSNMLRSSVIVLSASILIWKSTY